MDDYNESNWPVWIAYYLIILSPLEHIIEIETFLFAFCLCMISLCVLRRRTLILDETKWLVIYLTYSYVTFLWSEYTRFSVGTIAPLIVYGYLYLQLQFSVTKKQYKKLKVAMILQAAFLIFLVLRYGTYMDGRLWIVSSSTGLDPNYMSCWLLLPLCIDFEFFFNVEEKLLFRLLCFVEIVLIVSVITLTGSRAGFITCVVLMIACIVYSLQELILVHPIYAIIGFGAACVLIYLTLENLPDTLLRRLSQTQGAGSRGVIWKELVTDLLDHPAALLVGFGKGTVTFHTSAGVVAHNTFLDILFEYGLVGITLYLKFYIYAIKCAILNDRYVAIGMIGITIILMTLSASSMRFLILALLVSTIKVELE